MSTDNVEKKILHVCTIDKGGAYNGAKCLNEMLIRHGHDSRILVRTQTDADSNVTSVFDCAVAETVSKMKNLVNLAYKKGEVKRDVLGTDISDHPLVREADIIILHWISTFLSPKQIYELTELKEKKVIFWMHDMWLFTGGCHVDRRCGGYQNDCANCAMAGAAAFRSFARKKEYIQKADLTVCGPSHWIVEEARKSSILKGKEIIYFPNTFDKEIFCPGLEDIRSRLGFSKDKKIILFGAADRGTANGNKGFNHLLQALESIDMRDKQLVVIRDSTSSVDLLSEYDAVFPGFVRDEHTLADIYRAADVFVNPSLQESFGYTVCESMACATPAVAFAVGGMLDQIEHKKNGYLADYMNSGDLAEGIEYCLENRDRLSAAAVASADRFSYDNVYKYFEKII